MNRKLTIIARTGILLALVAVLQFGGKLLGDMMFPGIGSQILVGSCVNFILILATFYCGVWGSIAVGLLTPVIAFLIGQMGFPVMMPFIMIANIIIILSVVFCGKIKLKPLWTIIIGVLVGSVLKFLFMNFGVLSLAPHLGIPPVGIKALTVAFGILQLITALIGGTLAIIVRQLLVKANVVEA